MLRINDVEVIPSDEYNIDTALAAFKDYCSKQVKNKLGYVDWLIQNSLVKLAPTKPAEAPKRKPRASLMD